MTAILPPGVVLTHDEQRLIASYRLMDKRGKCELMAKALRTAVTRAQRRPVTLRLVAAAGKQVPA